MRKEEAGLRYNPPEAGSVSALVARRAPEDVPVVGAFHNLAAGRLANLDADLHWDVPVVGDDEDAKDTVCALAEAAVPATAADWGTEFLDLILAMKVVPDAEAAMDHIETYGSRHTEAVVAEDVAVQEAFVQRSGASCTMVNASTRFNDGGQLGLGAEIGISTTRVHAFGPMGLEELTTQRWVVRGSGQTRG